MFRVLPAFVHVVMDRDVLSFTLDTSIDITVPVNKVGVLEQLREQRGHLGGVERFIFFKFTLKVFYQVGGDFGTYLVIFKS